MINGPQVLVCLGCDTLREVEAREGRNVCPMCTLVNEPGKTKCELCDTELVNGQEAPSAAGESSDQPMCFWTTITRIKMTIESQKIQTVKILKKNVDKLMAE